MKRFRVSGRSLAGILISAYAMLLPMAHARTLRKIELPLPGNSVRIVSKLRSMEDHREFIFHGESGKKVKIELTGAGPLRGLLTFPSGSHEGGPGGIILDRRLTENGEYRLRVSESTMGEAWEGAFTVEISVANSD